MLLNIIISKKKKIQTTTEFKGRGHFASLTENDLTQWTQNWVFSCNHSKRVKIREFKTATRLVSLCSISPYRVVVETTPRKKGSQNFDLHTCNLILTRHKYPLHVPENASTWFLNTTPMSNILAVQIHYVNTTGMKIYLKEQEALGLLVIKTAS